MSAAARSWSIRSSPSPSTSIARRATKWPIASFTCAGQEALTQRTATSPSSRTTVSPHSGQADGISNGTASAGRCLEEDAGHLRDDVARLLDGDGVADADVLAREVLVVVEGRAADGRPREEDRLELGDGRQDARPPHLDDDRRHPRRRLLGRELVGEGPARELRRRPEPLLVEDGAHLQDGAVGLEVELVPLLAPLAKERADLVRRRDATARCGLTGRPRRTSASSASTCVAGAPSPSQRATE